MTEAVEVTQADREAAAKWAKMQGRPQQAANMRRGACDSAPLVQAFARHRLAEREAVVAWLRKDCMMRNYNSTLANEIEAGEHLK